MELVAFSSYTALPALFSGLVIFVWLMIGFFMLSLVLYYFTGSKPGAGIFGNFMRVGTRFYLHFWMLISWVLGAVGFAMILRAVMGAIAPEFTYARSGGTQELDLQLGAVLFAFSVAIFVSHWLIARSIETERESRGTFMTKLFVLIGLLVLSIFFFGTLLVFGFEFMANLTGGTTAPGGTLSIVLGMFPAWLYFAGRAIWLIRNEK